MGGTWEFIWRSGIKQHCLMQLVAGDELQNNTYQWWGDGVQPLTKINVQIHKYTITHVSFYLFDERLHILIVIYILYIL